MYSDPRYCVSGCLFYRTTPFCSAEPCRLQRTREQHSPLGQCSVSYSTRILLQVQKFSEYKSHFNLKLKVVNMSFVQIIYEDENDGELPEGATYTPIVIANSTGKFYHSQTPFKTYLKFRKHGRRRRSYY